jgi:uncharacterized protein (UPF0332 family)
MSSFASSTTLLRLSKAEKRMLNAWREGVHLEASSGHSIEELRHRSTADRLGLARSFRRQGDRMLGVAPPMYRDALSRYYYSMYHAMRAVVFFVEDGDDFQEHSKLPGKTPDDFPQTTLWQNALKDARTKRNAADYDAYPKSDRAHRTGALELQEKAQELEGLSRAYLLNLGCKHL